VQAAKARNGGCRCRIVSGSDLVHVGDVGAANVAEAALRVPEAPDHRIAAGGGRQYAE
jgi:hypothetical protein